MKMEGKITFVKPGSQKMDEIMRGMIDTYIAKNADYGDSFNKSLDEFGLVASVVRMGDKMNRISHLAKHKQRRVTDESIRDTLLDLANYAIMTVMWIDDNRPAEETKEDEQMDC